MNKFINRERELASLNRVYQEPAGGLVVLYGRRRLGKTSLLREFSRDKRCVYYMADQAAELSQRNSMARVMADALNEPLMEQMQYAEWYDLFAAFDRLRPGDQKTVLIIDEYQYLCKAQPAFSSFLQKWWDEQWKNEEVLLILSGSLTSMMYRETLAHSSPLYGRSSGQILLRPLGLQHIPEFINDPTEEKCVERYALCGGVPRYLELFQNTNDFESALLDGVLNPDAPLHVEARYLLQDEIDVPNVCWSLMEAIASGATRISEMASRLAQPANSLTRYLSLLRDLSMVEREVPVAEKNPSKSKRGVYVIKDSFLRLWFGCVYPYESFFEIGNTDAAFQKLRPLLNRHIELTYEMLCREYVLAHPELAPNMIRVGRQWGAHYEVDVAGVNAQGCFALLGECKWSRKKVGLSVLRDLQETVRQQNLSLSSDVQWVLFSRSGFSDDLQALADEQSNIRLISRLFKREGRGRALGFRPEA